MHRLPCSTVLRCQWTRPEGTPEDWLCSTLGGYGRYPTVSWTHRAAAPGDVIDPSMSHAGDWTRLPKPITESIPSSSYIGDIRTLEVIAAPM